MFDPTTISQFGQAIHRDHVHTAEKSRRAQEHRLEADHRIVSGEARKALFGDRPAPAEAGGSFSPSELKRLHFVRWLHRTNRLEP